ncbi:HNH endonuclease [Bacillus sp. JJ689]|uniref:HNH endonuclease n=1 Tax=Bacillus sp. JJ689 TaxID=3122949 RepID=UPI003F68A9B5
MTAKRMNICKYGHKYDDSFSKCNVCKPIKKKLTSNYTVTNSSRWRKFAKRIKDRDEHICIRCLVKYKRYNTHMLQVHHVKSREHYPELIWEDTNCLTVCARCNGQLGTKDELDFHYVIKPLQQYNI